MVFWHLRGLINDFRHRRNEATTFQYYTNGETFIRFTWIPLYMQQQPQWNYVHPLKTGHLQFAVSTRTGKTAAMQRGCWASTRLRTKISTPLWGPTRSFLRAPPECLRFKTRNETHLLCLRTDLTAWKTSWPGAPPRQYEEHNPSC